MTHSRIILFLGFILAFQGLAGSNQTRPLQCYVADADAKNLYTSTAWSTVYSVVPYRVILPLAFLFKDYVEPSPDDKDPSTFKAGAFAALKTATAPASVFLNAAQVLAVASFLVPPYFIRRSEHSTAECQHAESIQRNLNATRPLECYLADADDSIFTKNMAYAFGLAIGVYVLMPILFSAIPVWIKGTKTPELPVHGPQEESCCSRFLTSLGKAFSQAMIAADKYALIDASQVIASLNFFVPIWGWLEKFQSRAECDHALANATRANGG